MKLLRNQSIDFNDKWKTDDIVLLDGRECALTVNGRFVQASGYDPKGNDAWICYTDPLHDKGGERWQVKLNNRFGNGEELVEKYCILWSENARGAGVPSKILRYLPEEDSYVVNGAGEYVSHFYLSIKKRGRKYYSSRMRKQRTSNTNLSIAPVNGVRSKIMKRSHGKTTM
jgi:hypothetical protein